MSEAPTPDQATTSGLTALREQHVDAATASVLSEADIVDVAEKPTMSTEGGMPAKSTPVNARLLRVAKSTNQPKVSKGAWGNIRSFC